MNKQAPALLLAALLGLSQCKKKDPDPVDQLPPATQTGANTFGCLVNGQVWTPQGNDGTANYTAYYDRTFRGGNFGIRVYRLDKKASQDIIMGGDSISRVGTYSLIRVPRTVYFGDNQQPATCQSQDGKSSQYCRGGLTITRLDTQIGIVSGTFWFTLYKPGCDSIRVTDGRFDRKL